MEKIGKIRTKASIILKAYEVTEINGKLYAGKYFAIRGQETEKKIEDIVTRHEPVVLSRAKSATFISVILQNNKNTVQLHFGCTVFFEFTDNAVQSCSCTALPNKRAAMHCTISLSLVSSGMALQNARAAAFEEFFAVRRALPISSRTVSPSTPCLAATRSINSCSLKISHPS